MRNDVVMTYEEWEAVNARKRAEQNRRKKREYQKLQRYFLKQKLFGLSICCFGLVVAILANLINWYNLNALAVVAMVGGLYIMITREMLLVDDYFLEVEEREQQY